MMKLERAMTGYPGHLAMVVTSVCMYVLLKKNRNLLLLEEKMQTLLLSEKAVPQD
jgi:hypothetical protein